MQLHDSVVMALPWDSTSYIYIYIYKEMMTSKI